MARHAAFAPWCSLVLAASLIGCQQNAGSPIAPIAGGTTGPSSAPSATPSAVVTATAKPSPAPTASSTSPPTTAPVSGNIGSINVCGLVGVNGSTTVPVVAIPGNYTLLETLGNVAGGTYTQSQGMWAAYAINSVPSPSPSPSPVSSASATPVPSGTPISYDVYLGSYTIPGYTVTPNPSASPSPGATPIVVEKTVGCGILIESLNGPPIESGESGTSDNAGALGVPNIGNGFNFFEDPSTLTPLAGGLVTSVSLTNLSSSGASGSFVLDSGVTGTLSLNTPAVLTEPQVRALRYRLAKPGAFLPLRHR